jgi:hypothetical protein
MGRGSERRGLKVIGTAFAQAIGDLGLGGARRLDRHGGPAGARAPWGLWDETQPRATGAGESDHGPRQRGRELLAGGTIQMQGDRARQDVEDAVSTDVDPCPRGGGELGADVDAVIAHGGVRECRSADVK